MSYYDNRIKHSCSCSIEFIRLVAKSDKMRDKPRILSLSPTRLINSILHEHSCRILYIIFLDIIMFAFPHIISVACLATDACLTADPGVASSIPVRSHTFVEIDHEIISTVILLPSADSFKKGCCQLQAKVCARSTG